MNKILQDRCVCCFKTDDSKGKLTTEDHQHIKELVGNSSNVINLTTGIICVSCNVKLKQFIEFRIEIINTQQKFAQLSNSKVKIEPIDDVKYVFIKEEISDDDDNNRDDSHFDDNNYFDDSSFIEPKTILDEDDYKIAPAKLTTIKKRKSLENNIKSPSLNKSPASNSKILSNKEKRKRKDAPSEKDHFCQICGKYFTEARKVKAHIDRIHNKKKDFSCDMCLYTAFKKYDILLHIKNIHKPKSQLQKNSICPNCGLSFCSNSRLNIHIRRKHLKATMRKISCDKCGHRTHTINEMKNHLKIHFSKELREIYSCELCEKEFYSKGSLKTHKDVKHQFSNYQVSCFCGKVFKQKSVYQRHFDVIHLGNKPHKCSFCDKSFSGKTHLDYHIKAAHTVQSSPIPCEICGTLYKSLETLKRHIIYHSQPKFKCEICGKMFHENKKLMDHGSVHQTLQFPCNFCSRSFRLETQLAYHLKKVHFKEKLTFRCELCSSTFTRKSTYRDHALRQHKDLNPTAMTEFLAKIRKCIAEEHKT